MLGSEYVIDHCVLAFNIQCRRESLEYYVTDALKVISESVAERIGGRYMEERFADLMNGTIQKDDRTADEIAADIIERAGLKVG